MSSGGYGGGGVSAGCLLGAVQAGDGWGWLAGLLFRVVLPSPEESCFGVALSPANNALACACSILQVFTLDSVLFFAPLVCLLPNTLALCAFLQGGYGGGGGGGVSVARALPGLWVLHGMGVWGCGDGWRGSSLSAACWPGLEG